LKPYKIFSIKKENVFSFHLRINFESVFFTFNSSASHSTSNS
jgi:hypothetical protein